MSRSAVRVRSSAPLTQPRSSREAPRAPQTEPGGVSRPQVSGSSPLVCNAPTGRAPTRPSGWCRGGAVWCRDRICKTRALGGHEVPVDIEEHLRRSPTTGFLYPQQVRPSGNVETREGVPQAVGSHASSLSKHSPDNAVENPGAEVLVLHGAPCLAWESKRIGPKDIRAILRQRLPKPG